VSMEVEDTPVGYPGFRVARPPRLRRTSATLKRIALAKLSDIKIFSASFRGESFLFLPWLTVLIDRGDRITVTGVYRTNESASSEGAAEDPRVPTVCLRKSDWDRVLDLQQAPDVADPEHYFTYGPQVKNIFVFANHTTHPGLADVMNAAVSVLVRGISVEPINRKSSEWISVDVELADDRLNLRIDYSPLLARSQSLESVLPAWIEGIDELVQKDGLSPDSEIVLSIRRSVPEIVHASPRTAISSRAIT
jgi:hypothetical protein